MKGASRASAPLLPTHIHMASPPMPIGQAERDGIYISLIREQTRPETVGLDLPKENASFTEFSFDSRGKKFGSVV